MSITRRRFVQGSLVTTAGLGLGLSATRRVLGANDDIRFAVIGLRGRGNNLVDWQQGVEGTRLVALCDVDERVLTQRAEQVESNYEVKPDRVSDYRRLLEREDIDAIVVATPNHTHSLISIEAIQAGKDVYCEKPVSHTVWEGRQLVNAARRHDKIVQTGTQSRSSFGLMQAVEWLREGNLGEVQYVVGTCYKSRQSIGLRSEPLEVPEHIDYNLWLGPAADEPIHRNSLHYDWHWDFNTGNGDLGNQGIHQMDLARWFLGADGLSPKVMSVGGRVGYEDAGNTPNTQVVYHEYEKAPLIFEVRGLPESRDKQDGGWGQNDMDRYRGMRIGVVVQCEGGSLVIGSYSDARAYDRDGEQVRSFSGGGDHMQNFVDAVRSRSRDELHAEIEQGHLSSALCHTGNISYRLGRKASAAEIRERVEASHEGSESFGRMAEHLGANGIKLNGEQLTLGPWLEMDPRTERFTGSEEANELLHRRDREPFVVPSVEAT